MPEPTILILDPHRDLAEMAGEVLRARGYGVLVAEHFEIALQLLDTTPSLKIAVCHATLPSTEDGGHEPILEEFLHRDHIALVVISSKPFSDVAGIPPNATQLLKPFGANELLDAINQASAKS